MLNRLSAALAFITFAGVLIIFLVLLVGREAGAGYSLVTAFVIFVSSVPIGIPVVTTTVLAVGARQMAKEKAIVARYVLFVMFFREVCGHVEDVRVWSCMTYAIPMGLCDYSQTSYHVVQCLVKTA